MKATTTTKNGRAVPRIGTNWVRGTDAAEMIGVTRATLWNWRNEGKIRFAKIGGAVFYDIEEFYDRVEGAANQNSAATTNEA